MRLDNLVLPWKRTLRPSFPQVHLPPSLLVGGLLDDKGGERELVLGTDDKLLERKVGRCGGLEHKVGKCGSHGALTGVMPGMCDHVICCSGT